MAGTILTRETTTPACRVCGEAWDAHPKLDHAWDTPPLGAVVCTKMRRH